MKETASQGFKPAINEATILNLEIDTFIKVVSDYFSAVEFRTEKIREYLKKKNNDICKLVSLVKELDVNIIAMNALEDFSLVTDRKFRQTVVPAFEEMAEYSVALDCDLIITVPSFMNIDENYPKWDYIKSITARRLEFLAERAAEMDLKIGFEPLGFPDCSVRTINQASEILDLVGDKFDNVGLVVDTFHFFTALNPPDSISRIKKLFLVHINDLECDPFSSAELKFSDSDRIMPGNGQFPINEFLKRLITDVNYGGYISVELFNEYYWNEEPQRVAETAYRSLLNLFSQLEDDV